MILEHAWLKVTDGREAEFEAAMAAACPSSSRPLDVTVTRCDGAKKSSVDTPSS